METTNKVVTELADEIKKLSKSGQGGSAKFPTQFTPSGTGKNVRAAVDDHSSNWQNAGTLSMITSASARIAPTDHLTPICPTITTCAPVQPDLSSLTPGLVQHLLSNVGGGSTASHLGLVNQAVPYPLPHVGGTTSLPYPPCPEQMPGIPYPISSGFGNSPLVTNNNPSAAVSQRAPYLLPPQPPRVTVNNPRPLLSMSIWDLGQ